MVRIDEELLRKKAEHNEGRLTTLEEVSLHQHEIEKIENLHLLCRHLQILYLQNNLISKIENVGRLKELKYLNVAVNNIRRIENLEGCESLEKLDLTCNFVDDLLSFEKLQANWNMKEIYLIGNPCCEYEGYREFIIATIPTLERLDGKEITKAERIAALQNLSTIRKRLEEEDKERRKRPDYDDDPYGERKKGIEEYATKVVSFTSEGSVTNYSAGQLVGEPLVYPNYGEDVRCWGPSSLESESETLELEYKSEVYVHGINIFETNVPGCIVEISTYNASNGQYHVVWSEAPVELDNAKMPPAYARVFNPPLEASPFKTNRIRIRLNTKRAKNALPQIDAVKLLGTEITHEEEAAQEAERKARLEASRQYKDNSGPATKHTPAERTRMVKEMAEQRDKKNQAQQSGRDKLTGVDREETEEERARRRDEERIANGEKPRQTNQAGLSFEIQEDDDRGNTILDLAVPKYMDTSLLELDVNPGYVRCMVKGRPFCIHLGEEINPDSSKAERSQITGKLRLTLPHAKQVVKAKKAPAKENLNPHATAKTAAAGKQVLAPEERLKGAVDVRNIVNDRPKSAPLIAPVVKKPEAVPSPDFVDDPDVPPLE